MGEGSIQQFLDEAKVKLACITDEPSLEAALLLAHVLDKPRSFICAWPEKKLTEGQRQHAVNLLERRINKEPIAYIIGRCEFWSLDFLVCSDTLIPRPETELLVELTLDLMGHRSTICFNVADLGTGSGAVGLSLAHECPSSNIFVTDSSEKALQMARKNAQHLAVKNVSFYTGCWCSALPGVDFDIIVSNPPYIAETEWHVYSAYLAFEPPQALLSGRDGLDAVREISQNAKDYLKSGGYILIEHGFLQGRAVREIFTASGYANICTFRDLSGQERVTRCQMVF